MDQDLSNREAICDLLKHLRAQDVLFDGQVKQGLDRVRDRLGDLALDSPCATEVLEYYERELTVQI
jgi:hypothetical protein